LAVWGRPTYNPTDPNEPIKLGSEIDTRKGCWTSTNDYAKIESLERMTWCRKWQSAKRRFTCNLTLSTIPIKHLNDRAEWFIGKCGERKIVSIFQSELAGPLLSIFQNNFTA